MKALALSTMTAAMLTFAAVSYGQTSGSKEPGANAEFPTAGAPLNAPTLQEQLTKAPGSAANAEFPSAGAPLNAPTPKEQLTKTPGSAANAEFPSAGAPIRDKRD